MDLVRFGLVIRALRRRHRWRQLDLAIAARVSQSLVSRIERGHADQVLLLHVMAVVAALEARMVIDIRWRGGELDRLLDHDHAEVAVAIGQLLSAAGWEVRFEVTYAIYRASGSIDVLAWHALTATLLVIEIKTEIASGESTIRKLDEKVRLGPQIAFERFGWRVVRVARLLAIEDTTTARRRVGAAGGLFDAAFPDRGVELRRWLRAPMGDVSGLLFLSSSTAATGMSRRGGRHRVRTSTRTRLEVGPNVPDHEPSGSEPSTRPRILTNRT